MNEYFTLETVRDQLLQTGSIGINFPGGTFPSDWKYCPCIIVEKCSRQNNITCSTPMYVGMFIRTPNMSIPIIIEIIYERETHQGFVRANNMKINELISKNIINRESLDVVTRSY